MIRSPRGTDYCLRRMRNEDAVRLHLAGATHSELFETAGLEDFAQAKEAILKRRSLPGSRAAVSDFQDDFENAKRTYGRLLRDGVKILKAGDGDYPVEFEKLSRRPFLLYVRGTLPKSAFCISIVGSRKASPYGIQITERFVADFSRRGIPTVSGGASGIDTVAHSASLDSGAITYAFVGTGIDVDYPRANAGLFRSIVESGGAVVSAFAPSAGPNAFHFPIRNALVAAYSAGTLVTEAAEKSGSLITARLALDFGKEVFAVPGDINRQGSVGANSLIRSGMAKCVLRPEDVLEEFPEFSDMSGASDGRSPLDGSFSTDGHSASARAAESSVLNELQRSGTSHPEDLARTLALSIDAVLSELSRLELSGLAASDLFGSYSPK